MSVERNAEDVSQARRQFLAKCGKFAVVTPPVVTLMLTAAHNNYAAAVSGVPRRGPQGNNGFGNGGSDGVPGRSANNPSPQAPSKAADVNR